MLTGKTGENVTEQEIRQLIKEAERAREYAYAPYSDYSVGAALLCNDGRVYRGCNIENVSYPAGNCAERTAIFNAVSNGSKDFCAIAIVGGKNGQKPDDCPPCGICRQVLSEFCDDDFCVILSKGENHYKLYHLSELLPLQFRL